MQAVYAFAAEQMKNGTLRQQIQAMLVEKGLDQESAATVISNLTRMRSEAKKNMLYGALWCIGGIVVTAVTYSAALGGGTYVVTWGVIVFGAIQFFRGIADLWLDSYSRSHTRMRSEAIREASKKNML